MKELSIEEKAKLYDEAKARMSRAFNSNRCTLGFMNEIFPELKESEDEKIKDAAIEFVRQNKSFNYRLGISKEEVIAWLEKQESYYTFEIKEGHWYKCVCDYMLNGSDLMFKNDRLYYCRSNWRLGGEIDERNVKDIGVNGHKSFFRPATNQEIKDWLEKQGRHSIYNVPSREVILSIWDLGNEWKELTNGSISTEYGTQLNYIQKHWRESEYYLREKQGEQKHKDRYTFKSIPRLLDRIEPTDKAKSYCQKLIDSLLQEGYATAKIVSDCLKQMNGEKVAMAVMDIEKQGEQPKEATYTHEVETGNGNIKALVTGEIPIDKVEPKFKVGDWVVSPNGVYWHIDAINNNRYIVSSTDGACADWPLNTNLYHLWTIEDAKEGDVLATKKGNPFIYDKNRYNNGLAYYYAGLDVNKELTLKSPHYMLAHFGELRSVFPATKEQRELLFQKMKDAGYEWDADKKELKKIEPKTVAWTPMDEQRVENLLAIIEGHGYPGEVAWLNSLKDRVQPNQEWSEEDEKMYASIIDDTVQENQLDGKQIDWLRNIKYRNFTRPQNTWKPSDAQMKALKEACDEHWEPDGLDPLYILYQQLKKLREG